MTRGTKPRIALLAGLLLAAPAAAQETAEDRQFLRAWQENIARGQLREARSALEDYLRDLPDSVEARLLLAEVLWRRGDVTQADRRLQEAAALSIPADLRVHHARVHSHVAALLGRGEEALKALDAGLEARPGEASLLSRKIELLAARGARADARALLAELPAVKMDRDGDPAVQLEYARAYLALNQLEAAHRAVLLADYAWGKQRDPRQAEALSLLGDTFRLGRTEDGISALKAYRAALEVDASRADCHAGIARVYLYRMEFDQAEEAIRAALGLDPRHLDALAAEAELAMYDRKFSEGLEHAEQGLAQNPEHRTLLACKAAALVLLGREEGSEALEAMLRVDSGYADGLRILGDLVAHNYRFAEAIPYYRRAVEIDPEWSLSYVGLAKCLANLGRPDEALEALDRFRELDPYRYPLADNIHDALRAVQRLEEYSSGQFRFYLDPLDRPVLGPLLGRLYDRAWQDLANRYELAEPRPVRVEVFPRHDDFTARSVGWTGVGILGVCFGDTLTLLSPRSEMRGDFHYESTAVHELAHVVSLRVSNQRVPRWLTEGISVYEEQVFEPYCKRLMDLELFNYYHSGEIVPILEMNRLFGGPKIMFGYYQGGLLCEFLVERYGQPILVELLRQYARDEETGPAIENTLGVSPEELDQQFLRWLEDTRISRMKVQPIYTEKGRQRLRDRVLGAEDPSAEELAQLAWAYHQAGMAVDRDDFVARALRKDPELPALSFLLADVAFRQHREELGRQRLEQGFARGGEEFFAYLRLADLESGAGETEEALEHYERARQCFPRYAGPGNPYAMRAHLFEQSGREQEALREWRAFCAIHESETTARWYLVNRALEREDFREAQTYLLQLRAIDPFLRSLHRDLARCQRELSMPTEAIESLRYALAVDPRTEPQYDPATPEEEREAADRNQRAEILLELADLYCDLGEVREAAKAVEESRELDPEGAGLPAMAERLEALSRRSSGADS